GQMAHYVFEGDYDYQPVVFHHQQPAVPCPAHKREGLLHADTGTVMVFTFERRSTCLYTVLPFHSSRRIFPSSLNAPQVFILLHDEKHLEVVAVNVGLHRFLAEDGRRRGHGPGVFSNRTLVSPSSTLRNTACR